MLFLMKRKEKLLMMRKVIWKCEIKETVRSFVTSSMFDERSA